MRISDWSSDVCSSDLYTLLRLLGANKSRTVLRVQTGGGVRKRSDVERLLAAGADRVVVGSIAVEMPAWVASWLNDYGSQCLTVALRAEEHKSELQSIIRISNTVSCLIKKREEQR